MTDLELHELRRAKWHLDGHPVRTLEEARSFLESAGFCLMFPQRPPLLAPTFIGAWCGSDDRLPPWQQAFADPRAQAATDLMVRLLRERDGYEANLFGENNPFLIASSIFPYFYALAGERNPKQAPKAGPRAEYSELACDTFAAIQRGGPISKVKLQETLGGSISTPALDHALGELGVKLRITRVDYSPSDGSQWDVLYRWSPDAVHEGMELSLATALSALLSKYLDCVVAADQQELESFFGNFVSRSRIREAVNALLAARELEFIHVGNRTLIQITPPKVEFVKPEFKPEFKKREFKPREFRPREFKPAGFKKPEFRKPYYKENRPQKPDFKRVDSRPTDLEKPKLDRPNFDKRRFDKPSFDKRRFDKPKDDRPKFDRPKAGNPKFAKSGFGKKPYFKKAEFGNPGFKKNWPPRPDFKRADSSQSDLEKPKLDRPNSDRPKGDRPKFDKPKSGKPTFGKAGFSKSGFGKSGFKKSGFKKSGFRKDGPKNFSSRPSGSRPSRGRPGPPRKG